MAGVLAVFLYTGVTSYQAYLSRKTLDAALDQQRAWLKIETNPKLVDTFLITKGGAFATVSVKITNVGNVPATFVHNSARLLVDPTKVGGPPGTEKGYLTECPITDIGVENITIFPGDSLTIPKEMAVADRADIDRFVGKTADFNFLIAECVIYRSGVNRKPHHTAQMRGVVRAGKPPPGSISPKK